MSASVRSVVKDNLGQTFDPGSLPHSYTYDANANLLTDTCIEGGAIVRVKTFTYIEQNSIWLMVTESAWINETSDFRV
jgi:YD repeat-containing protein